MMKREGPPFLSPRKGIERPSAPKLSEGHLSIRLGPTPSITVEGKFRLDNARLKKGIFGEKQTHLVQGPVLLLHALLLIPAVYL